MKYGQRQLGNPQRIGHLQIVPVGPRQLLLVEHAGAVAHPLEREAARQLVDRQQLIVFSRRPADQRQVVDERLGEISLGAKFRDRGRAVAFRQRTVIGPQHQGQVGKDRRGESQRLVQQDLARRVRNVVLPPHHMRHVHQRIVDHDGEIVGGRSVRADDDRIADDVDGKPDVAAHHVLEDDVGIVGHAEADRRPLATGDARLRLLVRQPPARAALRRAPFGRRGLTLLFELRRGAEAVVGPFVVHQLLGVRLVQMEPLGLPVRTVRAADVRPLVPVETEPAQILENGGFGLARRPFGIGVFDPEDEGAALSARQQPVEERRARVADVQDDRRDWGRSGLSYN